MMQLSIYNMLCFLKVFDMIGSLRLCNLCAVAIASACTCNQCSSSTAAARVPIGFVYAMLVCSAVFNLCLLCLPAVIFATTAGLRGRASQHEGLLLACACKASAHQPLLLPPHAALAAALEARGQHSSAVAALQYCLALLQAGLQQGSEGLAALGLTGFGQGSGQATHRVVLLQAAGFEGSEGVATPESVQAALEIALARNLALAGQFEPAVQLYGKLEQQGCLGSNPLTCDSYSWVCYGYAAQQLGQAGLSSRVLERAVDEAGSDMAKLHAVMALLQVSRRASMWLLVT
jgi:hypothetical protein